MSFIKYLYILSLPLVMITSCGAIKGTVISGTLSGAENMTIYLDEVQLTAQGSTIITEKVGADGKFKLSLPDGAKKGIYRIRVGEQIADLIMDGTEKQILLNGKLTDLNEFKYVVVGSPLTEEYLKTMTSYINRQMDVTALTSFTSDKADPLVAFELGARLFTFRPEFADLHNKVAKRMSEKYPDLILSKQYADIAAQLSQQMSMQQATAKIKVGEPAPEIALPGVDGKMRKLSDYKGKLVLIDFWASWCGPCRKANPHVVEVYDKYKAKGFDVLSVSLDGVDRRMTQGISDQAQLKEMENSAKQRWVGAIAQDQLKWDGHVSDLKKWECAPAKEYGVSSIPQTFLVGRDGKIVAINPRNDLEQQVQKFL